MKVIITGMHRSGTSMVAGLLQMCGLYLGNDLINGLRDNPRGHFEDRTFVRLNDRLLTANGGSWHEPPENIEIEPRLWRTMLRFVASWPRSRITGWKDPRACLTVHKWAEAVKHEGDELRVVYVSRPIGQVAMSLHARNKFSIEKGRVLYTLYVEGAMLNLRHVNWQSTAYEEFFKDWRTALGHLVAFLGLVLPADEAVAEQFIDRKLRHFYGGKP